jgi:hypothetical protein
VGYLNERVRRGRTCRVGQGKDRAEIVAELGMVELRRDDGRKGRDSRALKGKHKVARPRCQRGRLGLTIFRHYRQRDQAALTRWSQT